MRPRKNKNKLISLPALLVVLVLMVIAQACSKKSTPPPPPTDQDGQGLFTQNASPGVLKANFLNPTVVETLDDTKGMVYGALPNQKFIFLMLLQMYFTME